MAKSKNTSVSNSEPLLFSTEQYSSEIDNIEQTHQYDPYWNEIVLDSSEFLEENKQGISLSQLFPLPTEELVKETENCFTVGQRIFSKKEQREGAIAKIGKSGFTVDWDGWVTVPYSFSQIQELQLSKIEGENSCLPTPHSLQELVDLTWELKPQPQASKPQSLSKTIQKPKEFLDIDSPKLPSTQILETGNQNQENLTCTQLDSPAQVQALLEMDQGLNIQNQECGSMPSERSHKEDLISLLLKTPQDLSETDLDQFLGDSEWLDISGKIRKSYQQRNSAHPMKEKDCLLLPTPTTYPKGSTGCRPAGSNRLEQKLRPFIHKGDKLHPSVAGWMMGFPIGWVEQVLADTGEMLSVQLPFIPVLDTISKTDGTALTSMDEQLHLNKQRSLSSESVILQSSQGLAVNSLVKILEGKFKNQYGVVREIQEAAAIVDAFGKSLLVVKLDNLAIPTERFAIASKLTIENYREGSYLLNGRVGKVIESYDLEYFTLQYTNETKCYFWGQDDNFIQQLAIPTERFAIAPQELVEKFLRENQDHNINDSKNGDLEQPSLSPKKKIASGSLAPYLENKKLKNGTIVTYPRVSGERDPLNHLHWRWGYYYEIKVNGEWKNRSLPTPPRIVAQVKMMIENHCPVEEIKNFILQSKHKRGNDIIQ